MLLEKHVRLVLEQSLQSHLQEFAENRNLVIGEDREDMRLLVSILTLHQLERIASQLEDGQIAIINS